LGRTSSHRQALLANLSISLIQHGFLRTTVAKAKEVRRVADQLVSTAKRATVTDGSDDGGIRRMNALRAIGSRLYHHRVAASRLVDDIAPAFADRPGGYTRLKLAGRRQNDGAPMALVEWSFRGEPRQNTTRRRISPAARSQHDAMQSEQNA
jgi:large subunit ribosomal protein L17